MIRTQSLGRRLLFFAGGLVALALFLAWVVLGLLFERHVERQFRDELERHGLSVIAALSLDPEGRPVLSTRSFDPRFDRPSSGLYWEVVAPGGRVRSRSLWDGTLPTAAVIPARGWGLVEGAGPYERRVMVAVRDVQLEPAGPHAVISVAGDRSPVHQARVAFGVETGSFLAVLWLFLSAAAWLQVRLGLAPLERVKNELQTLRRAPGARLASNTHPFEIRPLTDAVNDLADARALDLQRARQRAGDLAHALKTPLTALRLQIDALEPDKADELRHSLGMVSGAVESELARATRSGRGSVAAAKVVKRLARVIGGTPDGLRLHIRNRTPPDLIIPLHEEVALEVLGALLENAARFALSTVSVDGGYDGGRIWLAIEDDGPGVPEAMYEVVLNRGLRLDQRPDRHGLGLAIAEDHVIANGGRLSLGKAVIGGLRVELSW